MADEVMEERGPTKGNAGEQNMSRTRHRIDMQHVLDHVREAARRDKKTKFTALSHHVTVERLEAAYYASFPSARLIVSSCASLGIRVYRARYPSRHAVWVRAITITL